MCYFFLQAIIESDPFALPYDTLEVAQHWGNLFARKISCKNVDCLRKMVRNEVEWNNLLWTSLM